MNSLGMDMGASSVKIVVLDEAKTPIVMEERPHNGSLLQTLRDMLTELFEQRAIQTAFKAAVTGTGASLLTGKGLAITGVDPIPAIHAGAGLLCPKANCIIEMGAQSARFLTALSEGAAPLFALNENCAGGTGSFFEDQMHRLGLSIQDYSRIVEQAKSNPSLSGRCSVFAKTDIIHHQQEGVPTADILLGLCYAAVRNFKGTIVRALPIMPPLALCGGVVRNSGVRRAVKEIFGLSEHELIARDELVFIQAAGAARLAETDVELDALLRLLQKKDAPAAHSAYKPLLLRPGTVLSSPVANCPNAPFACALGIDVGSTSTNLVLVTPDGRLADYQYLRTSGDPNRVVREGLRSIEKRLGKLARITAVGVTGSGRNLIGELVGADCIIDEITAQARGAIHCDPDVDTVFEIGGQDSKFISLKNGAVVDFQMNKICAAGTGSFIEEQAKRMGIADPADIGPLALRGENPVDLGERCTVFMESSITAHLAAGTSRENILAGLCHSTVNNYLHKVVGQKAVGGHIVLQGGVAYNPGIVAAFEQRYGERLRVSPHFPISGAVGVALIAANEAEAITSFKGFDLSSTGGHRHEESRRSVAGNTAFYKKNHDLLLEGYTGAIDPSKKTVGVPRVLVIHKFFPMVNQFFARLGFNVLISSESNPATIALSQQYASAETCYPVKLIYGHMMELVEKGADYIFLPRVHTMKHEASHVYHNYGCVYMQTAPTLVAEALGLEQRGITLLSPQFSLDFGQPAMASAMMGIGKILGKNKIECGAALAAGAMAVRRYIAAAEEQGKKLLANLKPDEKMLVLITRAYGIADPVLNMGIPKALLERGYKVITLSHLPAHDLDISAGHPNLYWPFGQHIISGAKLVRNHPNLYAVYLTNHGCGPDTMLSHLFAEEMGDKPYLPIEVDEHFSQVGVITRIEAFLNGLKGRPTATESMPAVLTPSPDKKTNIQAKPQKNTPLYLPHLWPYSEFIGGMLNRRGFASQTLPPISQKSIEKGREEATSKEYLSFTAMLGTVLLQAETARPDSQFLIPGTEGAEADGQYSRCVRAILDRKGYTSLRIVSPILERLPEESPHFDQLFLALLAGDVVWAAPYHKRALLADKWKAVHELSMQKVLALAKEVSELWEEDASQLKPISVIGEPVCLFDEGAGHGLLRKTEEQGYLLQRMPLSEYLWVLWQSRENKKNTVERLAVCRDQMASISKALGVFSSFSDDGAQLLSVADSKLFRFAGGNGRYRYAKCRLMAEGGTSVIMLNSLYENVGTILSMLLAKQKKNILELYFDDSSGNSEAERLNSFLYYDTVKYSYSESSRRG